MMLHWVAHSLSQSAFQIALLLTGAAIMLSGVFFLVTALSGREWVSARGSILGIVGGALWAATALLESDPRRHHLGAVLLDAGMLPIMFYAAQFTARRKISAPLPETNHASGTVWPPPPTSQGGG